MARIRRTAGPRWLRYRRCRWALFGSLVFVLAAACSRSDPYLQALTEDPVASWTPPDAELVRASDRPVGTTLGKPTRTSLHRGYRPSDGSSFDLVVADLARYAGDNGWSVEPSNGFADHVGIKVVGGQETRLSISHSAESDRVFLHLWPA